MYRYTWSGRLSNCGVEDLRADCLGGVDSIGNTDGLFMTISGLLNGWVRRCYSDKMRGHPLWASSSKWCTFEDITSYHNVITSHSGASTQIFAGSFSELCLWHRLVANSGGFEFSGGRQNAGPMAWVECQVPQGFAFSGPHEQWNMGYLWDSLFIAHNSGGHRARQRHDRRQSFGVELREHRHIQFRARADRASVDSRLHWKNAGRAEE